MRRLAAAIALPLAALACGGGGGGGGEVRAELPEVSFAVHASGLRRPEGLAFDGAGRLFVTFELGDDGEVVRIDPGGPTSVVRDLRHPDGITFDRTGALFVAEEVDDGRVYRITGENREVFLDGLAGPEALAFDSSGDLWITEDKGGGVLRVSPTGSVTRVTMLRKPEGIAIAGDGRVWVAESGADRIVRISPDGGVTPFVESGLRLPDGLAFDELTGNLFVGEDREGGARLLRIAPDGTATVILSGLREAQGIAIGPDRALYLAESGRSRILRVVGALAP